MKDIPVAAMLACNVEWGLVFIASTNI